MNFTLRIWRQQSANASGKFVNYQIKDVTPEMSFLEMLDALNEDLINRGEPPVAFEHDCREGICGSCGFLINGVAHGGQRGTTVCQLSMRFFKDKDGEALTLEPWRARAFPIVRDLIVNRSAFDRIIQAGGFISALWHRHRETLVIPSVVQEPFHEHAGPDAEESLTLGTSDKRSDESHVNGNALAKGGRKENGIDHPQP